MHKLSFDIETIPQTSLSPIQEEEIERKVTNAMVRDPSQDRNKLQEKLMATSPYFGEIITIGMHLVQLGETEGESKALYNVSEEEMLREFWDLLGKAEFLFISYNGLSFDVPFILNRSMKYGIKPTNKNFCNTVRFRKTPHFDAKEIISRWDRFSAPTLHLATDLVGIPTPKDGEVKADGVFDAWKAGEIEKIAEYCIKDVEATYKLYDVLKDY